MDAREKRCGERGKSQDREKRSVSRGKRWQGVRFIGTRRRRASTLFLSKPGFRLRSSFSFSPIIFITARDAISFFYPPLSLCQFFLVSSLTIFDSFAFFFFEDSKLFSISPSFVVSILFRFFSNNFWFLCLFFFRRFQIVFDISLFLCVNSSSFLPNNFWFFCFFFFEDSKLFSISFDLDPVLDLLFWFYVFVDI